MEQERQPLPAAISHGAKRHAGRTGASQTPLSVRTTGLSVDARLEDYVRERTGRRIGKFAASAERVTVRFEDLNGPKGGVDIECKMKIVIPGAPSLVVAERASDPRDAFDQTIDAAERALRRTLAKRGRNAPKARSPRSVASAEAGGAKRPAAKAKPTGVARSSRKS